jgi:NAD(P)-dependent dehydrogenase (short-subunit alcohol dehydrogenase family)
MQIKDRVFLITGGASGIGRGNVGYFHERGARVAIFDMNAEAGEALAAELGERALFARVDVTDEASVQAGIARTIEAFGAIHVCLNYAGIGHACKTLGKEGPFPLDAFNKVLQINLVGTFNVLRLAAEKMVDNEPEDGERGVIVNTASVAAFEGQMGQAAYSASKGGIVGMTLPIARDLAQHGIRVNTIAPGLIHTPLFESLGEKVVEALSQQVLNPQRLGRPEEIAQMAQAIVENAYVNGETIRVDGGIRMQPR